jgi:DNA-binding IclR family transcriptional regulator
MTERCPLVDSAVALAILKLIAHLGNDPKSTITESCRATGINDRTARKAFDYLEEHNIVIHSHEIRRGINSYPYSLADGWRENAARADELAQLLDMVGQLVAQCDN